jgi:hypothetical protein
MVPLEASYLIAVPDTNFGLWTFALSYSQNCEELSEWVIGLRAAALQYITSSIEVSHQ